MKIRALHGWDVPYREAVRIQNELRERIRIDEGPGVEDVSIAAGADISYAKGADLFFATVVLLRMKDMAVIEATECSGRVSFPYIPGLLSFREGPVLLEAFRKLRRRPDVVLFDGQGIAHPRGLGLASHMGLFLEIPSIGCAKSRLCGEHGDVGKEAGDFAWLKDGDRVVGAAVRTKKNIKPIYISPGHRVSVESAIRIALATCRGYRLPEPTRQAHLMVNRLRLAGC